MNIKNLFLGALVLGLVATGSASAATYTWTSSLSMGSKGEQVKNLQKFLNMYPAYQVSTSGAGSPGMETSYFGPATKTAVMKFQAANGVSAIGIFGPASRAKAMALQDGTVSTGGNLPAGCTTTGGFSPVTGQPCTAGNTVVQTGPVSASLATTNPASAYIVNGQATAGLLDVTFTGSGTVNSVTLQRSGISDQNTLSNVYLYDGVKRLTDGYSFNNSGQIVMNNVNIAVNGSRTISVKADAASNANSSSTIAVSLVSFSSGTTVNTVNIKGNDMTLAAGSSTGSASLGCNTVTGAGGVTTAGSCAAGAAISVNAGTSSYRVWSAPIQINTRTLWLKAANFRITGSAPSDALQNAGLYVDGLKVGSNAVMTMTNGSNYLSFDFSAMPVSLTTGSHTLEVRGDIVKGSSYNFIVGLQQASDLMITDSQVGINLVLASQGYTTFSQNSAAQVSIGTGSSTIVTDSTFTSVSNITGGASNAVIGKYKIRGYGEDVKVTSLTVTPALTNACTTGSTYSNAPCNVTTAGPTHTQFATGNGLQNVTLYFNGSQIGSQQSWGAGSLVFTLGSQMIIPAGVDSILEVRADIRTSPGSAGAADATATSGATYTAGNVSVNVSASTGNMEGVTSHTSPSSALTSSGSPTLTIQTGLLAVAVNPSYPSQSVTPNTSGAKIASFVLQNQSSSEAVRVTSLTVNPIGAGTSALTNVLNLRTSETSGNASIPQQPASTNTFTVDFTVPAGSTKVVDIFADTGATGSVTVIPTLAVTALGASSNTSSSVSAVTGQTISFASGVMSNTTASPTFLASSSTSAQYIASPDGKTDATKATYTFISTGGVSTITDLRFSVTGPVTSIRVGSISAPVVSGVAWLQGLSLSVPNNSVGLNVDAFVSYSTVGAAGQASATSGTTSAITLSQVKYSSGNGTPVTLGTGGTALAGTNLASATMIMTGSTPTVKKTSGAVNVGTGSTSNVKIGTVTITANDGDVLIGVVPVSVGVPTGGTASNWTVKVNGVAPAGITQPTTNTSGFSFTNGYQISKGNSVSFDFYVDFAGVTTAGNADITLGSSASFKWSDIIDGLLTSGTMTKTAASLLTYNQ